MRAAASDAVSSDKFGDHRQAAAGACESEAAPGNRRGWSCGGSRCSGGAGCVLGGGRGGWAPLGVHPSCGSLCWGGGRRSPWAAFTGDVGSLCSAPLQLPVSRPLPRLPTFTVSICRAPGSLEVGIPSSLQASGPSCAKRDSKGREALRLQTDRHEPDDERT